MTLTVEHWAELEAAHGQASLEHQIEDEGVGDFWMKFAQTLQTRLRDVPPEPSCTCGLDKLTQAAGQNWRMGHGLDCPKVTAIQLRRRILDLERWIASSRAPGAPTEAVARLLRFARRLEGGAIPPSEQRALRAEMSDVIVDLDNALRMAAPSDDRALRKAANDAITYLETGCFNSAGAVACAKELRAALAGGAPPAPPQ